MTKKPLYITCTYTTCGLESGETDLITPNVGYAGNDLEAAVKSLIAELKDNVANIIELDEPFTLDSYDDNIHFDIDGSDEKAIKEFNKAVTKLTKALMDGKIDTIDCQVNNGDDNYHDVYSIVTK